MRFGFCKPLHQSHGHEMDSVTLTDRSLQNFTLTSHQAEKLQFTRKSSLIYPSANPTQSN